MSNFTVNTLVPKEALTGAVAVTSTDHAYIHAGKAFRIVGKTTAVAPGQKATIAIRAPVSGKFLHWRPCKFSSTAQLGEVKITAGATVAGGSALTPVNQRRVNPIATAVPSAVSAPSTATAGADLMDLFSVGVGGSVHSRAGGGSAGDSDEQIFGEGSWILIEMTNLAASGVDTIFYYNIFWYEEDLGE